MRRYYRNNHTCNCISLEKNGMLSPIQQLLCTARGHEKLFVHPCKATHQSHTHTANHYFLQVMAQRGRKSGSVASYMGLAPGREEENRGGLFDLLAASVSDAEWSRWAPITSSSSSLLPPTGHAHEYNRWHQIGLWLCFQGVIFEVNGSIRLCFLRPFSGRQTTQMKMFSIAQGLWNIWL